MIPTSSTNLRNRVNKLHLPKNKPLLPLFEIISNSIHAIQEKSTNDSSFRNGKILIKTIRNGDEEALINYGEVEKFPIKSFSIYDNGIGVNNENLKSFAEFDSEKKAKIGGKGIGRLVCLKAYNQLFIDSIYYNDKHELKNRKFEYKKSKEGFGNYEDELETKKNDTETTVILYGCEQDYQENIPKTIFEIGREILNHFQLYFIQKKEPQILLLNQDNTEINLTNLFNTEFEKEILQNNFIIADNRFDVYISKSLKAKSHKIHYCAHERTVKDEGLSKYIEDLRYIILNDDSKEGFFYQVFVVGDYLNKNVNDERTNFKFKSEEDDEDLDTKEITLARIRKETLKCIEDSLSNFLSKMRKEKVERYIPIINQEFPNYRSVINYNRDEVEKIPDGLSNSELDFKLYQIESRWREKIKKDAIDIIEKKRNITSLEDYRKIYDTFLEEFNDVGKSDLARYVIHRRSVIDLLDNLLYLNEENKFSDENIIHSLFFPIKENPQTILHEQQNLWLIDERLTFNSYLASDKTFNQVSELGSSSKDRMDIVINQGDVFDRATLFSENKIPYESFTIVEFKKPERNDYQYGIPEKDPVRQVRKYIREILDGKIKKMGKKIEANDRTPFYCYIVADITDSLKYIIKEEGFKILPDGLGYFRFYDSSEYEYIAYIEILPFKKIIKDAKQRNKILFDKLKIS